MSKKDDYLNTDLSLIQVCCIYLYQLMHGKHIKTNRLFMEKAYNNVQDRTLKTHISFHDVIFEYFNLLGVGCHKKDVNHDKLLQTVYVDLNDLVYNFLIKKDNFDQFYSDLRNWSNKQQFYVNALLKSFNDDDNLVRKVYNYIVSPYSLKTEDDIIKMSRYVMFIKQNPDLKYVYYDPYINSPKLEYLKSEYQYRMIKKCRLLLDTTFSNSCIKYDAIKI